MTVAATPRHASLPAELLASADVRARSAGENFSVASVLAGRAASARLLAIYDYARLVDELGDAAPGNRLHLLDEAEAELDRAFAGNASAPIFRALEPFIRACAPSRDPFLRLIEANRRDQLHPEMATYPELLDYCLLSANPVGELVLYAFEVATPARIALSDSICTGLQLVEHWQDVAEDARSGRIYLPADDRERFGVTTEQLTSTHASEPLRRLLELETDRAETLLRAGAPLVSSLRGRARIAVAGYLGGGLANIAALRRVRFDVLAGPPKAGRLLRGRNTLLALLGGA
jgi:squalene synthase HpnC